VHKAGMRLGLLILLGLTVPLFARPHGKVAQEDNGGKVVDSGSFGIFQRGQRVATETFQIRKSSTGSVTTSEIRTEGATGDVSQSSELQLNSQGDLVKYLWKENKPEKSESDLVPGDQVIVQHVSAEGKDKPQEIPYVLPPSTFVLDDYFFVQREVLAWKYMATECVKLENCKMTPATFGVIIPRQHTSGSITIEFKGREKTDVHGAQQDLAHFVMHVDDVDWSLYLDDQQKLVKVDVPAADTQAVRD
jgi:hypothetical protein